MVGWVNASHAGLSPPLLQRAMLKISCSRIGLICCWTAKALLEDKHDSDACMLLLTGTIWGYLGAACGFARTSACCEDKHHVQLRLCGCSRATSSSAEALHLFEPTSAAGEVSWRHEAAVALICPRRRPTSFPICVLCQSSRCRALC